MKPLTGRWLKFNLVGLMGIGVQLGVLALLVSALHVGYLWATGIAVEAAVLHNFFWHERYTWRGAAAGAPSAVVWRILRFHAGNGMVSLLGNLVLMRIMVGTLHLPYLAANGLTIVICGLLNFAVSEWFVFRPITK